MTSANLVIALALLLVAGSAAAGPTSDFVVPETPTTLPAIRFTDGAGKQKTLEDYSGRLVLLNIWATWCAPCRKEMPTLDRLEATLGGPDFEVVALSMDRKGPDVVKKFFAETGVTHLALNIDSSAKAMFTLGAPGLPMTLLIDGSGREIGRLIGPAEWDSPEMTEFIRGLIAANREGK
ncbi:MULTISPECIES: TlpA disulfide reductase family protein [unclassified Mesorhizobium]|uniref:TlpA family protein disulfide reductase n=1 Tax=unclassified Mesorhizobium TaxID=325217 RepID=UPI000FCB94DC|nr:MULTISPECIES: TlpA disulfide reductase family protein [unclassified Mesorhizobium]RUV27142.1 TlpA family protein disulfide reductase [Mesorhizobium sp. M1A.F.Ca.IN.022.04.1.1]RWG30765.1 MAG: TlpA family protein disulfide reductase [Mesorhizobium sp.]